jgi:hydroxyacyl-ACP dehydratase HTD2-like protein with hotdog domain
MSLFEPSDHVDDNHDLDGISMPNMLARRRMWTEWSVPMPGTKRMRNRHFKAENVAVEPSDHANDNHDLDGISTPDMLARRRMWTEWSAPMPWTFEPDR